MVDTLNERQKAGLVAALMTGLLLAALDMTVVSTAMPAILADLGGLQLFSWVFSGYALTQTAAMPLFGKLSDLYGPRRLFLAGLGLFIAGSALCGAARTMAQMVAFRAIQGIGAGSLFPIAIATTGLLFPPEQRARLQGVFSGTFGVSSVLGPSIGAFIVEHASWRWAFYVNLPLGILSALLLALSFRETAANRPRPRVDYWGAVLLTGSIVSLMFAFLEGGKALAWTSSQFIGLVALTAVLAGGFIAVEARAPQPLIPLHLFRHRTVAVVGVVGLLHGAAMFGAVTFIPLFVQGATGGTAGTARDVLMPMMLSVVAGTFFSGRLFFRTGPRILVGAGLAMAGAGFWLLGRMTPATAPATAALYMAVTGLGVGLSLVPLVIAVQLAVSRQEIGLATSLATVFRSLGGVIGVSLLGAWQAGLLRDRLAETLAAGEAAAWLPVGLAQTLRNPDALGQVLVSPAAAQLPPPLLAALRGALAASIHPLFLAATFLCAAGAVISLALRRGKPQIQPSAAPGAVAEPRTEG